VLSVRRPVLFDLALTFCLAGDGVIVAWLLQGRTGHDSDTSLQLHADGTWFCFRFRGWGHRVRLRPLAVRGRETKDRTSVELRDRPARGLEKPR
jgi:hypothetical protein